MLSVDEGSLMSSVCIFHYSILSVKQLSEDINADGRDGKLETGSTDTEVITPEDGSRCTCLWLRPRVSYTYSNEVRC